MKGVVRTAQRAGRDVGKGIDELAFGLSDDGHALSVTVMDARDRLVLSKAPSHSTGQL
jgi:hypothetical protein